MKVKIRVFDLTVGDLRFKVAQHEIYLTPVIIVLERELKVILHISCDTFYMK